MNLLASLIIRTGIVGLAAYLLPGVGVDSLLTALVVAVVLGVLNMFIKPILVLLTLPVTILTLGLFMLVINALLILLASKIVPGFTVDGFWWAVLFSLVISIVSSFVQQSSAK